MKIFKEYDQSLLLRVLKEGRISNTEILVVGAGPSGSIAAIAASRRGAKVVLVEQCGKVGGMLVTGGVLDLLQYNDNNGRLIIGGIPLELVERLKKRRKLLGSPEKDVCLSFDKEAMETVLLEMIEEAKIQLKLYSSFVFPIMNKNTIIGVVIFNKSGFQGIKAKVVIDATGDADVAYTAGCPFKKGWGGKKNLLQAGTLCFRMGGVNYNRYLKFPQNKF